MSHWIIHSFILSKTTDYFGNKTSDCLYKWVIESFTQSICAKTIELFRN